jgi:site-specific recombinase XerD
MTAALASALQRYHHQRGKPQPSDRVLYDDGDRPARAENLREYLREAQRHACVRYASGALHILRHTFCSHLAMRGAPAKAIQELAGHEDLTTTMRYMHLSPAARESAIRLLEGGRDGATGSDFGDIVEKEAATG